MNILLIMPSVQTIQTWHQYCLNTKICKQPTLIITPAQPHIQHSYSGFQLWSQILTFLPCLGFLPHLFPQTCVFICFFSLPNISPLVSLLFYFPVSVLAHQLLHSSAYTCSSPVVCLELLHVDLCLNFFFLFSALSFVQHQGFICLCNIFFCGFCGHLLPWSQIK